MNKKTVGVGSVILAFVVGVSWAMGFFEGKDPKIVELEQLRDANLEKIGQMDGDQRRAQVQMFREKVQQLPEEQRRQFFESTRPMMLQMINQRLDSFFEMPEEQQNEILDKKIDRHEQRASNGGGGPGRGGGGKDMSQEQRDQRHKERLDRTTPELRAKFDKAIDMMNDRRKERGLPPVNGPGFLRGGLR